MSVPLLQVENVTKIYGGDGSQAKANVALDGFSLTIDGETPRITTIAGESGSGKTTLANLVLGFLTPTTGQVRYRGQSIHALSKQAWFAYRQEIQAIFQNPFEVYNPFYKVDHVFNFAMRKFKLARSPGREKAMIEEALEVVGLRPAEILGRYPHELSGGQRQRLMIARAFLLKPRLIVADEPVSMIDASLQARILDIFELLKNEYAISFLYITHDLSTAYQISDDIYVLYLGSVMEHGNIDSVMQRPEHPYTQLLLSSIPVPDPDVRWEGAVKSPVEERSLWSVASTQRCKYFPHCINGNGDCHRRPATVEIRPDHWVACHAPESVADTLFTLKEPR